jgi:uncharacterized protein (DUF885 family)
MVLALLTLLPVVGLAQQSAAGTDSARLHELFAQDWAYTMREHPEYATAVGYPGQNARWTDESAEALARRKRHVTDVLGALRTIDRTRLNATDQLSYDLFKRDYTDAA